MMIILFATILIIAFFIIRTLIIHSNNRTNAAIDKLKSKTTFNKLINNQHVISFRFGLYPGKFNACEAIAVHNAKLLKGLSSSLSETIREFHESNLMLGYGFFGTLPHSLGRILKRDKLPFTKLTPKQMGTPGVYIISFWNRGKPFHGLHTITVLKSSTCYTAFNNGGNCESLFNPRCYTGRYICIYFLGPKAEQPPK